MFKECLSQSISPYVTFLIIKCEKKSSKILIFSFKIIFRILNFCIKQSPSLGDKRDLQVYYRFLDSDVLEFFFSSVGYNNESS
jgi:hypothetical protein